MAETKSEYDQYGAQTGGKLFNNAMFGFNKEEVLEYLEEMAEENFQKQESAEHRIRELNQRIQALEAAAANQQHESVQNDGLQEEERRQFMQAKEELELSRAAMQQAEGELQQAKEQLENTQQENAWLREEYQKLDQTTAGLRTQLEEMTAGNWPEADEQIRDLQDKLQLAEAKVREAEAMTQEAETAARQAEEAARAAEARAMESERLASTGHATAAADTIIKEANRQADQIREEAWAEKDRLQKQIHGSAGGLATSIHNLRAEISDVEGDVTGVLETVQNALAEIMSSLGRAEQDLGVLDTQVNRFPSSSPSVPKPEQQVVYFQPGPELEVAPPRNNNWRAAPAQSFGSSEGFRRVWPEGAPKKAAVDDAKPFRATYSSTAPAAGYSPYGAEAYQLEENPEGRMRNLAESLVDTLVQMMT